MSLLFDHPRPLKSVFSIKHPGDDTLLLGTALWAELSQGLTEREICVAVAPLQPGDRVTGGALRRVIAWAVRDDQTPHLAIPPHWLKDYKHIFSGARTLQLSPVLPIPLSEVVLHALSPEAYQVALAYPSTVETWLCANRAILRQGATYTFSSELLQVNGHVNGYAQVNEDGHEQAPQSSVPPRPLQYRISMAEPVLQGYTQKGKTAFCVALADQSTTSNVSTGSDTTDDLNSAREDSADGDSTEDTDEIEIDEAFLANSLPSLYPSLHTHDYTHKPDQPTRAHAKTDGTQSYSSNSPPTFVLSSLHSPVPVSAPNDSDSEAANMHFDDDYTLYVRTADLGRIGMLNGDWAVAHSSTTSKSRLVRLRSDAVFRSASKSTTSTLSASPLLIHNLTSISSLTSPPSSSPSPSSSSTPTNDSSLPTSIYLTPSPTPHAPPLPTARTLTLARVASPLTVERRFEGAVVRGLRGYFAGRQGQTGKTLVKRGDMVAVRIDTDVSSNEDTEDGDGGNEENDTLPGNVHRANEVVFFLVTNIEYPVVNSDHLPEPPASLSSPNVHASSDAYLSALSGELGCWVDPSSTRIVQAGVEHAHVPDVRAYLGIDTAPSNPSNPSNTPSAPDTPFSTLLALISATLHPHAADLNLHTSMLLKGPRGVGKFSVVQGVARGLGMHLLEVNCYDLIAESNAGTDSSDVKTEATLRARFDRAGECSPCILVLRHVEALVQSTQGEEDKEPPLVKTLQECIASLNATWRTTGYPVVVCGTMAESKGAAKAFEACFKHEVLFEAPGESERRAILSNLLSSAVLAPDVSLSNLATLTAALLPGDLRNMVNRAELASVKRACSVSECNEPDLAQAGIALTSADFDIALGSVRASFSESIGAPKIPNVSWDDVGGLAHVKADLLDTIQLPLEHPELFADGVKKRSGILLFGPPGTGKTLVAKAVATSFSLNFFSIKGPELLNMYIGESEANVRRVFQRARDARPCVIFFDELDSIAPKRGNFGDSGGVMDRIVSQLLAELDGMSESGSGADVFVLGATNRPDLLDPALLRPGRFDRMLYLGVSEEHTAQLHILKALTRKFCLHPDLDLSVISEQCPFNYTGADFYALCSDALLNAMTRKAEELDVKIADLNSNHDPTVHKHPHPLTPQYYLAEMASPEDISIVVSQHDFEHALRNLVASVSQSEMEHYAKIQGQFSQQHI